MFQEDITTWTVCALQKSYIELKIQQCSKYKLVILGLNSLCFCHRLQKSKPWTLNPEPITVMEKLQSTTQSLLLRVHSENENFQYRKPSSVFKNPRKIETSNKDIYNYLQNQVWIRSCLQTLWWWFSSEIDEVVVCLWGEFAHSQSNLSNICV
jgi:hypothetical protein